MSAPASSLQFRCPCGAVLACPPVPAGSAVLCPRCRQKLLVPADTSSAPAAPPPGGAAGGLRQHPPAAVQAPHSAPADTPQDPTPGPVGSPEPGWYLARDKQKLGP